MLAILQEQLRLVRIKQRTVNPLDAAVVANLNESEAAIMTRVTEKRVQMAVSRVEESASPPRTDLTRVDEFKNKKGCISAVRSRVKQGSRGR